MTSHTIPIINELIEKGMVKKGDWEDRDGNGHWGGPSKQIITWGGSTATFRSDQIEYSFKWASVREINTSQ